jgi:adenine-specific DNA methylase
MPAFIETQFPIARLSAESYKERKAGASQTLTGLGKWWGRKPLILVRASILGMLMPASNDPKKDREIHLKILTMDDEGTWDRCKPAVQRRTTRAAFDTLSYAERIANCERPENVAGPSEAAWAEINAHLGTTANSLPELVEELGRRSFGHTPRVGDSFCGGGSIPFEAARIGCEAFASDLNPVAGLLTWASLNLLGGGQAVQDEVRKVQEEVFAAADKQITEWGIEHNDRGERAEAFLYCVEVKPEGCDYYIPLAPSWVISEKYRIVATWQREPDSNRLQPTVLEVSEAELALYKNKKGATVVDSRVLDPFDASRSWSVEALRGPEGLRRWSNDDVIPRPGDVFQERLYCIRWINAQGERRYAAPDAADLAREAKVLDLLRERFTHWQSEGYIPSKAIPDGGDKTEEPIRTRGWTHWHHLFTPRQLLMHGLFIENWYSSQPVMSQLFAALTASLSTVTDNNSRLCRWTSHPNRSSPASTFSNQALNTLFNYPVRALAWAKPFLVPNFEAIDVAGSGIVAVIDARDLNETCDFWITDPPYADAVNYHELADFFLAWYDKQLAKAFPEWIPDARAELAVRGDGEDFRRSMVEIYQNLARHMPDNGMQMVMFTHQDPSVWADLGMILWAAGLKATAAWTISTETEAAGIKKGNYVQGTVCLVLRKRTTNETGFLDEVFPLVEDEVKRQIASMQALDEGGEPNFNDADYQLAAYAAALKVLTQYGNIDGKDVEHEVFAVRARNEKSHFQMVIERAIGIACDILVPRGLEHHWRALSLSERYYLRSLDIESRGERRKGMYEELARGFGVTDIRPMLNSTTANGTRMMTASRFGRTLISGISEEAESQVSFSLTNRRGRGASAAVSNPFAFSHLRHLLFAIKETVEDANSPEAGRQYLRDTFGTSYWNHRDKLVWLLDWIARLGNAAGMEIWQADSEAARILAGRLRNDEG